VTFFLLAESRNIPQTINNVVGFHDSAWLSVYLTS
jgi:hypothetical protein